MVQKKAARRGRPRAYDPEAALDSVLDVFWRAGYAGTSLDDICGATGMNRPSLYAAFGDKRALYFSAIERYRARSREQMRYAIAYDRPLKEALTRVYDMALDIYFSTGDSPLGCFMLATALTGALDDPEIRDALTGGMRAYDQAFENRIRHAQEQGDIAGDRDPAMLAKSAAATLYFLAIRSRAGESRESLKKMADASVALICGE